MSCSLPSAGWWNQRLAEEILVKPACIISTMLFNIFVFPHGKWGEPSANRVISQPWENAFSFSQAGFLIELSWTVFCALYYNLVLVCLEGHFFGAYHVLLPEVCYNIETLCVCVHGSYRHGCVMLCWLIYHTETLTHCSVHRNTIYMKKMKFLIAVKGAVYLYMYPFPWVVAGFKAVVMLQEHQTCVLKGWCAWHDIPALPVGRNPDFSLGVGVFWSADKSTMPFTHNFAEEQPWLGDFRILF